MSPYIRIDFECLDRFSRAIDRDLSERVRPHAQECTAAIDEGSDAVGADARFSEAHAVRARGIVTAESARQFVEELVAHVDAMGAEVRHARTQYKTMDQEAADRISEQRGRVWLAHAHLEGSAGGVFADAYKQHQADAIRGRLAPR